MIKERKGERRQRRKLSIRRKIFGTSKKPRVSFFRSNTSIYVQVIDDEKSITICSVVGNKMKNAIAAKTLGKDLAKEMKSKKIDQAVFDRNGYQFHGVIKAFVDALREDGIKI